MLVYGDPHYSTPASGLLRQLRSRLDCDAISLEGWRTLLIEAGQLEQGLSDRQVSDASTEPQLISAAMRLTDHLAAEFHTWWEHSRRAPTGVSERLNRTLMELQLASETILGNPALTIKVPEGFAFYALFPEQYCAASLKWAAQRPKSGRVLVVGIRSIGTTLSAVVKQTLVAAGWDVRRVTVRPTGHPFQRQVELRLSEFAPDRAIVVDEGPGISGSSMAAVARACRAAGVRDVSFLPGHSGGPGASATADIRVIWNHTACYVTGLEALKWNGLSLEESLARKAQELQGDDSPFDAVQDVSCGQWRKFAFGNEGEWPGVAGQFERMKFLCVRRNGNSVLWKFAGLHCTENGDSAYEAALKCLSWHARAGFGPMPLGTFHGFVALPWIEGTRLTRAHALDNSVCERIGNYILHAAGPALSPEQQETAVARLAEMLYWNTKDALGDAAAERSRASADSAHIDGIPFSYGDGRLAPHEWIRASDGTVFKADAEGHTNDHTLIGKQSVLWDVAGVLVEWNLSASAATTLLSAIERAMGRINPDALAFYCQAYAAFRFGLLSLATQQTSDAAEKERLRLAGDFYLSKLAQALRAELDLCRAER